MLDKSETLMHSNFGPLIGLTGVILAVWWGWWLKERSVAALRRQHLDEIAARSKFWIDWLEGIRSNRNPRKDEIALFESELTRTAELAKAQYLHWPPPAIWTPAAYRLYLREVGYIRRVFLLCTQRPGFIALVCRWQFLIFFSMSLLCSSQTLSEILSLKRNPPLQRETVQYRPFSYIHSRLKPVVTTTRAERLGIWEDECLMLIGTAFLFRSIGWLSLLFWLRTGNEIGWQIWRRISLPSPKSLTMCSSATTQAGATAQPEFSGQG